MSMNLLLNLLSENFRLKEKNIHFKIENSIQLKDTRKVKDTRNDQTKFSNFRVIDSKRISFFIMVFLLILQSCKKETRLGKCFRNLCIKQYISFSSFMPTITSYFGFLLAALTITSALFIGLSKVRLI